ncbi:Hypothetical protein PHPALM_19190, partial [Phytophthora palmivora]
MREGSELLSRLRDQLVTLPEIKDLTPECKIEEADVGVPGRTTPEMEDQDVLHFLGLNSGEPTVSGDSVPRLPVLTDEMTVFQRNIPAPSEMGPVLGRSSYIDDIAHGAPTWEQLCQDLN